MLSTAHLTLKRPSRKLDHKFISPFQIQQLISPTAVRLTLPHKWRTHPTFHVAEVEPFVPGNRPVDYEKVLHEVADIEADEEYDGTRYRDPSSVGIASFTTSNGSDSRREKIGPSSHRRTSPRKPGQSCTSFTSTTPRLPVITESLRTRRNISLTHSRLTYRQKSCYRIAPSPSLPIGSLTEPWAPKSVRVPCEVGRVLDTHK